MLTFKKFQRGNCYGGLHLGKNTLNVDFQQEVSARNLLRWCSTEDKILLMMTFDKFQHGKCSTEDMEH